MKSLTGKITGDLLLAVDWNELPQEVQNAITSTGQSLSTGDLLQLVKAVSEYSRRGDFFTDSGSANTYVLSTVDSLQAPTAYKDGSTIRFIAGNSNTGASTANTAGIGVIDITDEFGAALTGGEISSTQVNSMYYDSGSGDYRLITVPIVSLAGLDTSPISSSDSYTGLGSLDDAIVLAGSRNYAIEGAIRATASGSGMNVRLDFPGSGTADISYAYEDNVNAAQISNVAGTLPEIVVTLIPANSTIRFSGSIRTDSSGTLGVQFKREVSAGSLQIFEASWIKVSKLP